MRSTIRLACLTIALTLALGACTVVQDPADVARFHGGIGLARDKDRTKAVRVAAGISAAQAGVSLGCTMLWDAASPTFFDALRRFCAARDGMLPKAARPQGPAS